MPLDEMRRRITWRHWAWATAIAALIALAQLPIFMQSPMYSGWGKLSTEFPRFLLFSYVFMVAIVAAESLTAGAAVPMRRYLAAALIASAACLVVIWCYPIQPPGNDRPDGRRIAEMYERGVWDKRMFNLSWLGSVTVINGIIGVLVYAWLRNSRLAAQALANAESERAESEQRLAAARLEAVQAEVDPDYVLGVLAEVESAYETDRASAEAMLDELIAFLRAAIPRLRANEPAREPQAIAT